MVPRHRYAAQHFQARHFGFFLVYHAGGKSKRRRIWFDKPQPAKDAEVLFLLAAMDEQAQPSLADQIEWQESNAAALRSMRQPTDAGEGASEDDSEAMLLLLYAALGAGAERHASFLEQWSMLQYLERAEDESEALLLLLSAL